MGIQSKYTTVKEIMSLSDFYLCHTGGNCTAYKFIDENGDQTLITDGDLSAPEDTKEVYMVSLYNSEGEQLAVWADLEGIEQALHAAKFYVMEYYADKEQDEYHILNRG